MRIKVTHRASVAQDAPVVVSYVELPALPVTREEIKKMCSLIPIDNPMSLITWAEDR